MAALELAERPLERGARRVGRARVVVVADELADAALFPLDLGLGRGDGRVVVGDLADDRVVVFGRGGALGLGAVGRLLAVLRAGLVVGRLGGSAARVLLRLVGLGASLLRRRSRA